jgi:predicted transcriptional regulator
MATLAQFCGGSPSAPATKSILPEQILEAVKRSKGVGLAVLLVLHAVDTPIKTTEIARLVQCDCRSVERSLRDLERRNVIVNIQPVKGLNDFAILSRRGLK